jgi:hypothetical protein
MRLITCNSKAAQHMAVFGIGQAGVLLAAEREW